MNIVSLRNSAALQILQDAARAPSPIQAGNGSALKSVPFGSLDFAVNDVTKRALAKIAAIINTAKGTDSLPQTKPAPATAAQAGGEAETGVSAANNVQLAPFAQMFTGTTEHEDGSTVRGGDRRDVIRAQNKATVSSGGGDDLVSVFDDGTIDSGEGNDTIYSYDRAIVTSGEGHDRVSTNNDSTVDAGSGDDFIDGTLNMTVNAGDGNDEVRTYQNAKINAGEGNDWAVFLGYSDVEGGSGNDTLIDSEVNLNPDALYGHSTVDGGEGDDYIQISINSTASGGTGNDTIRLTNTGGTVLFNKGDGQDVINSREDFTLRIGGFKKEDIVITKDGDATVVSFNGSDDRIALNVVGGATAHLTFEDGSTLDVDGIKGYRNLESVISNPDQDWSWEGPRFYKKNDSLTKVI